jgi:hypothetical protein
MCRCQSLPNHILNNTKYCLFSPRELSEHPEYGCMLVNHTSARTNPTHLVQIWRR